MPEPDYQGGTDGGKLTSHAHQAKGCGGGGQMEASSHLYIGGAMEASSICACMECICFFVHFTGFGEQMELAFVSVS